MIITYPMLISASVSPNVIPGLVKAVEKYILVYNTDKVLRAANIGVAKVVRAAGQTVGATLKLGRQGRLTIENTMIDPLFEASGQQPLFDKAKFGNPPKQKPEVTVKTGPGPAGPRPNLDIPKDSVALEPTWLHVTTEKKGLQILGVKVIPFRVETSENIINIIMSDTRLKGLDYMTAKYSRTALRVFFRFVRAIRLPAIKDKALTGDPKFDLLWGGTRYGADMFVGISQLDLDGAEEIFSKPGIVRRVHKLGWASLIITDDVNKKATFCMREFGGVCSSVPYAFMYSSLGKDHAKVYEDLEDIKRSASPFFRMSTRRKKVFGEAMANTKLNDYLSLVNEDELDEKAAMITRGIRSVKKFAKDPLKTKALKRSSELLAKKTERYRKMLKKATPEDGPGLMKALKALERRQESLKRAAAANKKRFKQSRRRSIAAAGVAGGAAGAAVGSVATAIDKKSK